MMRLTLPAWVYRPRAFAVEWSTAFKRAIYDYKDLLHRNSGLRQKRCRF